MKNAIIWIIVIVAIGVLGWWLYGARSTPSIDEVSTAPITTPPQEQATQPQPSTQVQPIATQTTPIRTINTKDNMKIEIIKEGTGLEIKSGQSATVDYVGKLADGSVFDASKNHGTTGFTFSLGAGQVIKGWDEGVLGMKVGETRILTIPPELGYGASGYPPVIPANATLTFEVTLLAIK